MVPGNTLVMRRMMMHLSGLDGEALTFLRVLLKISTHFVHLCRPLLHLLLEFPARRYCTRNEFCTTVSRVIPVVSDHASCIKALVICYSTLCYIFKY